MPVGRPRKSAAYHKLVGNYRPSRHAEPVGTSPEPAPERIEFEDLDEYFPRQGKGSNDRPSQTDACCIVGKPLNITNQTSQSLP
jgi:hypothetical protein